MILPKPLRKFVAIFRGEVSPLMILLSVTLGFWFGLTPGWYGVHVGLLALVLIINVHIGIFLLLAALGKALCYAAAPLWFHVGHWVQAHLAAQLSWLGELPVIGITDFSRYSVAGAMLAGPLLGLIGGLLLARSVAGFRRAWLKLEENSEAFRKWHSRGWVRLLDRVLLGKRAQDVRAVLKRRMRIIRWTGVAVALVLLAASAAGLHFVQGDRLATLAADSLTRLNGAEVNVERFELAALSGRVSASGIQVTDPAHPTQNRIAVAELTADAGLWGLLRGKLVMDNVVLANVQLDQPRDKPGAVTAPPPEVSAPAFEPLHFELDNADVAKLEAYFKNAQEMQSWLEQVASWLPEREAPAPPAPPAPQRYLDYVTARAPVPPRPRVVVRRLELKDVAVPAGQFGRSTITCTNLSDLPAAAGLPLTIAVESHEHPTELRITCHYDRPQGGADVEASVGDLDLRELQTALKDDNPVVFDGGTASARFTGHVDRRTIDVAIPLQTQGMRLRSTGGGLFGLDPQITAEAMKVLESVQTNLRLVGPITQPRLVFDAPSLTNEFKNALVQAGKGELARRLDEALADQLPGGLPKTEEVLDDPLKAAGSALGGVLDAQKSKDEKDKKKPEDKKKKPDPLEELKKRLKKD